ncbi:unnamed protein product [Adineta ricciae]|nr:unnamed protein product [Adineta ricciae]
MTLINVFLLIFGELFVILDDTHLNYFLLLYRDLLEQICSFLKVFDQVMEELSEDKTPTIYKVFPLRQRLLNHCDLKTIDHDSIKELKVFLSTKPQPDQSTTAENILSESFDLPIEEQDSEAVVPLDQELTRYLALNETISANDDVLLFWKNYLRLLLRS